MKTVIVPVDFSINSLNAAKYAAKMLTGVYGVTLILYTMYEKDEDHELAETQLSQLKDSLMKEAIVKIELIAVKGNDLIEEIDRVTKHRQADLLVMGITGKTDFEQIFMGSNTLKVVEKNICPALIIPGSAEYVSVKNVALTSDFKNVRLTTPSVPIKKVLDIFKPTLHIVNVDSQHYVSLSDEYQKEKNDMQEMFGQYHPEYYFIGMNDFHEAIEQFIADKKIDILITVPKRHSFLSSIFKSSHTKKLVYHTNVPILAVHE